MNPNDYDFKKCEDFRQKNKPYKYYYNGGISAFYRQNQNIIITWLESNFSSKVYGNVLNDYLAIFTHLETTGTLNSYKKQKYLRE